MPDVTIRRCVLRVVRRGGWSWGPEPRTLVDDAVRTLPALLAAELARVLPHDVEGELSAPLRLDVRVGLPELRAGARNAARDGGSAIAAGTGASAGLAASPTHEGIAEALRRALAAARPADRIVRSAAPTSPPLQFPMPTGNARARTVAVLNLLTAWRAVGALDALLQALPDAAVAAWHCALLECEAAGVAPASAADESVAGEAAAVAHDAQARAVDALLARLGEQATALVPAARMRVRVLAAVELAASTGVPPTQAAARALIDNRLPLAADLGALPRAERPRPAAPGTRRAPSGLEVRVASALPFLLLGPLRGIGWLDVLDATLAAADVETTLPALAVALATKVLPEPERGWRRTPATVTAAAAFAGDAGPRPDAEIADLARIAAPLTPALDAVVQRSLLDGRRPGDPLVLCAAGSVWLLVDPEGVFLIAHADGPDTAAARASESKAPIFVPEEDADTRLLAALDRAGVTFVTPALPVRGETWQLLPGSRSPRLFTNGRAPAFRPPPADTAARARETWQELERRPFPGRPLDPALERGMSLAAALALATIAWKLWRGSEPTDAALALGRFGDLEGTVRFEDDRVRVRLPLGKRFHDLEEAGFLDDVPRVPWLGFRPVVFAGG